mmetsp:Transcript_4818/g.10122  ORF Transcript_4818/g.10122 Transcript_4818/m.10122 type:complete len:369 (-) Transcript_4818:1337-2443(-)
MAGSEERAFNQPASDAVDASFGVKGVMIKHLSRTDRADAYMPTDGDLISACYVSYDDEGKVMSTNDNEVANEVRKNDPDRAAHPYFFVSEGLPIDFVVGSGGVVRAWELACKSMKEGEKVRIWSSASFRNRDGTLTEDEKKMDADKGYVVFDVEILSVIPLSLIDAQQRKKEVEELKKKGNEFFQSEQYRQATAYYRRAALCGIPRKIEETGSGVELPEDEAALHKEVMFCHLNAAAALEKQLKHTEAIEHCDSVMNNQDLNDVNVNAKALYRKAVALHQLKRMDEAEKVVEEAASLLPDDRAISSLAQRIAKQRHQTKIEGKNVYKRMVSSKGALYSDKPERPPPLLSQIWTIIKSLCCGAKKKKDE